MMKLTTFKTIECLIPPIMFTKWGQQYGIEAANIAYDFIQRATDYINETNFTPENVLTGGAAGLVIKGYTAENIPAVLKVCMIDKSVAEIFAITSYPTQHVPNIFHTNVSKGVYMLEFVEHINKPVNSLQVHEIAKNIRLPYNPQFDTLHNVMLHKMKLSWERVYRNAGLTHQENFVLAYRLLDYLTNTTLNPVLLNADMHTGNIINSHNRVVSIDPLPCNGDPEADIAVHLAWRGHTFTPVNQWKPISSPRLDLWYWLMGTVEENLKDPQRLERKALLDYLKPSVIVALNQQH